MKSVKQPGKVYVQSRVEKSGSHPMGSEAAFHLKRVIVVRECPGDSIDGRTLGLTGFLISGGGAENQWVGHGRNYPVRVPRCPSGTLERQKRGKIHRDLDVASDLSGHTGGDVEAAVVSRGPSFDKVSGIKAVESEIIPYTVTSAIEADPGSGQRIGILVHQRLIVHIWVK